MRLVLITIMIALLAGQGLAGIDPVTVLFDRTLLEISAERREVGYPGCQPAGLGGEALLCSKTFYVELLPGEQADSIGYDVSKREPMALGFAVGLPEDVPTSAYLPYDRLPPSSARHDRIGLEAVHCGAEVLVCGRRLAKLTVFPVTVDSSGQAFFNESISVTLGPRFVHRAELLSSGDVSCCARGGKDYFAGAGASGAAAEYVIVTSAELAAPCRELARYKTSTGYRTAVVLIDDILAAYSGRDDAERLREYLIQFYSEGGRWVLLAGDETVLPLRYAYHRAVDLAPSLEWQPICDLYFADLNGLWDVDGDGVWGEPNDDQPDLTPELYVGRLPFNMAEEVSNYVEKLIAYETSPGEDRSYLGRAFFFSSDQMRDYSGGGQHARIARAFPEHFLIDTVNGVEAASGHDSNPHNKSGLELLETISDGWGIINAIAHGGSDAFCVKSAGYNQSPKSLILTNPGGIDHGYVNNLAPNGNSSFYYSLACSNGGFDQDGPPFYEPYPNLVQTLLGLRYAGAVGFVANSRWGWVSSSHLLQKTFFDSLFAYPDRPAVAAMYASREVYYYYRDLVYGQNFYGDPTLKVYTDVPDSMSISLSLEESSLNAYVTSQGNPVESCLIVLSVGNNMIARALTGGDGSVSFSHDFHSDSVYTLAGVKTGYTIRRTDLAPSIVTGVDEDGYRVPRSFALSQNYPNPFNPATTISFDLGASGMVNLSVYNLLGQRVKTLQDEPLSAGSHTVHWDGKNDVGHDVASGVYLYRLESDSFTDVKKMVLVR